MREMYSTKETSPTAVFNSIIDNPAMGDERDYVKCRITDDQKRMYSDEVAIRDDIDISVYVWIDNSSIRADQAITGAHMDLLISSEPSASPALNVYLTGDNVVKVWNGCKILSTKPTTLSYIPGSATLHIHGASSMKIADAVIRGDKPLPGVRGNAEGVIGGDAKPYGYVEFRVTAFVR